MIELARIGGLSSVMQKGNKTAPEKKGIYAFLWPNITLYLASNFTGSGARAEDTPSRMEQYQQGIKKLRRFKYDGDLWLTKNYEDRLRGKIKRYSKDGNWVLVDSNDARKASQRMHNQLVGEWNSPQPNKGGWPRAQGHHNYEMFWAQAFIPAHKGKIKGKKPKAQRVAQRHLEAGLIEPPPVMVDKISEWVSSVKAATLADRMNIEGQYQNMKRINTERRNRLRNLRSQIGELRAMLEKDGRPRETYKAYMEVYNTAMWLFGYTNLRKKKPKAFSKAVMGDREARKGLLDRINRDLEDVIDRLEHQEGRLAESNEEDFKKGLEEQFNKLMGQAGKTKPFKEDQDEISKNFFVKLDGWKDGQKMIKRLREGLKADIIEQEEAFKARYPDLDKTEFDFEGSFKRRLKNVAKRWKYIKVSLKKDHWASASWSDQTKTLTLTFSTDMSTNRIRKWVKHELRHMTQAFLTSIAAQRKGVPVEMYAWYGRKPGTMDKNDKGVESRRDTGRLPGNPSKKILTPKYKQHDNPRKHRRYPGDENAPIKRQLHHLDDVEFYTDLADEIEDLKDYLAGRDPDTKIQYFKYYVGMSNHGLDKPKQTSYGFFGTLKKFAEGKWRKAVGEAYKAIFGKSSVERVAIRHAGRSL